MSSQSHAMVLRISGKHGYTPLLRWSRQFGRFVLTGLPVGGAEQRRCCFGMFELGNCDIAFDASEGQQSWHTFSHPYGSNVPQIKGICSFDYGAGIVWIVVIMDGMARQLLELRTIKAASVWHW
jgi:hypothetical protein